MEKKTSKDFATTLIAYPTIKFTYDFSCKFLDVQIIKVHNKLVADFYVKPTDTHELSFCHVYHSKIAVPYTVYSQALRPNRICS